MYDGRRGPILVVGKQRKYEEGVGEVGVDRREKRNAAEVKKGKFKSAHCREGGG